MTINCNKDIFISKKLLIILISSFLLLFLSHLPCFSQSEKKAIELSFLKQTENLSAGSLYFNVLKIWNNTTKPIVGNVTIGGPENWEVIAVSTPQTILNPRDTVFIPIRISPSFNTIGGIAYIINATFRGSDIQTNTSCYLTLPKNSKWEFSVNKGNAFLTESKPNATFQIRLSNKGNTNELVRLKSEVGKLLKFTDDSPNSGLEFVTLKAFSDTVITRAITTQKNLSYIEKSKLENNWKESAVNITASTDNVEKNEAIQFTKLYSEYVHQREQNSSPLNIDYQIYNLMSNQPFRQSGKIYGSLLFSDNREVQYLAGLQNIAFEPNSIPLDINSQLIYNINYTDNHNNIQLGYNINGGSLHSINGRGIKGTFRLNQRNSFSYAFTQNPYSQNIGEFVGYTTAFKRIQLSTEISHENKPDGSYQATSALLGIGVNLFKHHTFSFRLLGSKSDYLKTQYPDTSVVGFSYQANYNVQYKKLALRLSSMSSEYNYIQNSGLQQSYVDGKYFFNDKLSLLLYGTHQKYSTTRFPYNFYNPINFNVNDNLRFTTALSSGNIVYQLGPNYTGSIRQYYSSKGYKSEYFNYQPGVWCAATIKFDGYKSITPNLTVSNIRFYYQTNDPNLENYSLDKDISYSAGISYFDYNWRINAFYTSGTATDLYRSVLVDSKPTPSSSIQFRPSYENYFFNRKVKLSASLNYAYYMPSGRENTSINLRYDQYFKKGWNLSVSGFMYSNTRVSDEQGRISTKDMNVFIGFSKSFNIQQPRTKYYNYKSIFFNDLDGNKIKTDNEPPVTDIVVNIQKDRASASKQSNFPEMKLITNEKGAVSIENMPKDNYKLTFTPVNNLQKLYFIDGAEQKYFNDKTRTVYIPLAESYKIKGKIILVRDPNSTEGKINLEGIRIIATNHNGETYQVLTDNSGAFVLSVPSADKYLVHINNVFGPQFNIDNNEMEVQFTENKTINVDFTFIEKVRGVEFNGGEIFKFNSLNNVNSDETETSVGGSNVANSKQGNTTKPIAKKALLKATPTLSNTPLSKQPQTAVKVETPKSVSAKPVIYAIQLDALKNYRDPSYYNRTLKLTDEVLYSKNNGVFKYYTGNFSSLDEARSAIEKAGIKAMPVAVDPTSLQHAQPIVNTKTPTTYMIQLDVLKNYRDPSYYKNTLKLSDDVFYTENNGVFKYYTGKYSTLDEARNAMQKAGIKGMPAPVDTVLLKHQIQAQKTIQPSISSGQNTTNGLYLYTIKLSVSHEKKDPTFYKQLYNLPFDVIAVEDNDGYNYFAGKYESVDKATADIGRYGLTGYVVSIDVLKPLKKEPAKK